VGKLSERRAGGISGSRSLYVNTDIDCPGEEMASEEENELFVWGHLEELAKIPLQAWLDASE